MVNGKLESDIEEVIWRPLIFNWSERSILLEGLVGFRRYRGTEEEGLKNNRDSLAVGVGWVRGGHDGGTERQR